MASRMKEVSDESEIELEAEEEAVVEYWKIIIFLFLWSINKSIFINIILSLEPLNLVYNLG